jgi:pimeloyl-ACP methyl ester carboxylesterase
MRLGAIFAVLAIALSLSALFTFVFSRWIESRFPLVGERVAVGGGALHVVETARPAATRGAVLLIHGASGNFADLHVALADELADLGFRVFSVDRPGHGWSARLGAPNEAASPERQGEWIREALARVDRAIVVGHSLAGVHALALALNSPRFARGLVLLAPVSHPWPGGVLWYYTVAASRLAGPLFRWLIVAPAGLLYMRAGVAEVFAPTPAPPGYIERTRLPLVLRPRHFRANAEDVVALAGHVARLSKRYGAIRAPTTIVTGDRDSVVYARLHSVGCAADIPGATLRVLPNVGHSPHFSAREAVIEAILEVDRRAGQAEFSPAAAGGVAAGAEDARARI